MDNDTRVDPPRLGSERETLRGFLGYHRRTLAMKCAGLSDEELQRRAVAPSALSLLGLVRHIAEVERAWFRRVFEDRAAPMMWSPPGVVDFQLAYDASASTRAKAFAAWEAEVENGASAALGRGRVAADGHGARPSGVRPPQRPRRPPPRGRRRNGGRVRRPAAGTIRLPTPFPCRAVHDSIPGFESTTPVPLEPTLGSRPHV